MHKWRDNDAGGFSIDDENLILSELLLFVAVVNIQFFFSDSLFILQLLQECLHSFIFINFITLLAQGASTIEEILFLAEKLPRKQRRANRRRSARNFYLILSQDDDYFLEHFCISKNAFMTIC